MYEAKPRKDLRPLRVLGLGQFFTTSVLSGSVAGRLGPVFHYLCLVRISGDVISRYHVSQVANFWTEELTLLRLEL